MTHKPSYSKHTRPAPQGKRRELWTVSCKCGAFCRQSFRTKQEARDWYGGHLQRVGSGIRY